MSEQTRLPFEPEMVLVPAGEFLFGTSDEQIERLVKTTDWANDWVEKGYFDREKPQQPIILPDYWIGKYSVTVGEYRYFIDRGGYRGSKYWTQAGWEWKGETAQPEYWADPKWTGDDRLPVVGASWFEAVAYCNWLAEATGRAYRLPGEAEWEKAARGTEGRIFPWGDEFDAERCNFSESGIGHTTPVGSYPAGASPCGALDMAGNVWEWCASKYADPYHHPEDNETNGTYLRALRGGSWLNSSMLNLRAAFRNRNTPDDGDVGCGFRCARSSLALFSAFGNPVF